MCKIMVRGFDCGHKEDYYLYCHTGLRSGKSKPKCRNRYTRTGIEKKQQKLLLKSSSGNLGKCGVCGLIKKGILTDLEADGILQMQPLAPVEGEKIENENHDILAEALEKLSVDLFVWCKDEWVVPKRLEDAKCISSCDTKKA